MKKVVVSGETLMASSRDFFAKFRRKRDTKAISSPANQLQPQQPQKPLPEITLTKEPDEKDLPVIRRVASLYTRQRYAKFAKRLVKMPK